MINKGYSPIILFKATPTTTLGLLISPHLLNAYTISWQCHCRDNVFHTCASGAKSAPKFSFFLFKIYFYLCVCMCVCLHVSAADMHRGQERAKDLLE